MLSAIHDLVIYLLLNGYERIYFINVHDNNITYNKATFDKIYLTALERKLDVAKNLDVIWKIGFYISEVYKLASELYGKK